jgi:predicted small metal-binding protein
MLGKLAAVAWALPEGRGNEMRMLDCPCGRTLQAATDDELVGVVREHVEEEHPDMEMGDDQIRGMIGEQAYSASDS